MRKITRYLLTLIIIYLIILNVRMFSHPNITKTPQGNYNKEVYQQLQFLKDRLHSGEGEKMQNIYPEGYIFLHALYGLAWANTVKNLEKSSSIRQEAINELKWTLAKMETEKAKNVFQEELYLPYGVYYQGWLNLTRAQYLNLNKDENQAIKFQKACQQIAAAVNHHYTPFLYSYSYGCWPADNMVALAALTTHDQLFAPRFDSLRSNWLEAMQTKLDENGLIPHSVDLGHGNVIGKARGSSQSLMLAFLIDIDSSFAYNQYQQFKKLFIDERFGLPGIKEYIENNSRYGDIDSGPVILGIGGAASLVGMGTCGQFNDMTLYNGLSNSIKGFGMTYSFLGKRRYLFGKIPIADAFIAWSQSRVPLHYLDKKESFNYWKFRFISLVIIAFLLLLLKRTK